MSHHPRVARGLVGFGVVSHINGIQGFTETVQGPSEDVSIVRITCHASAAPDCLWAPPRPTHDGLRYEPVYLPSTSSERLRPIPVSLW